MAHLVQHKPRNRVIFARHLARQTQPVAEFIAGIQPATSQAAILARHQRRFVVIIAATAPVIASSTSPVVTMPSKWPYSS
jgi:hypothetical protein